MRIAILSHGARGAGATSVARNLIAALGRVAPEEHYLITIPPGLGFESVCEGVPNCQAIRFGQSNLLHRWFWENWTLPHLLREHRPDVLLGLADRGLTDPPCPQAVLIHRSQLFYPVKHYASDTVRNRLLFRYHAAHLRHSLPHTQLLLCQTEAARERLRAVYGYKGRIEICPNAVSVFAATSSTDQMPEALKPLTGKTKLFCLTRYYPHKNLERIVELFRTYREALVNTAVIITIAPEQHPHAARLLADIRKAGLQEHIVNVGPVPQEKLGTYYHHCDALFLPTFLESFSGTYLEAMHFGVPILTSDLDFAHVVCGDAAVYFDPWSVTSILDAIRRIQNEPGLAADLVERGRRRLSGFFRSWDEIATDLHRWLREIANGGSVR